MINSIIFVTFDFLLTIKKERNYEIRRNQRRRKGNS